LEEDAGIFSVPSKVLTYHCAGRALLLSVPADNLAARIVKDNQTGLVIPPRDEAGFMAAAETLLNDAKMRNFFAAQARAYAEQTFDIEKITDNFEKIIFA
jgi:colanic acid biosynthesis glycosyl transferase WcaI